MQPPFGPEAGRLPDFRGNSGRAAKCPKIRTRRDLRKVAGTGREQVASYSGNSEVLREGGAESGAVDARAVVQDAELAEVVAAWPELPKETRIRILAVVRD